jgi:hypothetical protein
METTGSILVCHEEANDLFELFLIFCIALIITMIVARVGIVLSVAIPAAGLLAGGLLGFAYSGTAFPGAVVGLLAAGSCKFL